MEELILLFPSKEHGELALEYIKEFTDYGSAINGTGGLDENTTDYDEWLVTAENFHKGINMPEGFVPGSTYFAFRKSDGRMIGTINIRHALNDYLLKEGGHIGYSVRPTERKKGYASLIMNLALATCLELGLDKLLLTCDKKNVGSAGVIKNNFGILENEITDEETGEITQRYWIDVNYAIENKNYW